MRRLILSLFILPLLMMAHSAQAAVTITFYSHDFDDHFPHTFFTLQGTVDLTGQQVDDNYGFTAANVSPAILLGSVKGEIEVSKPKYVAHSRPHFKLELTDEQYWQVLAKVEEWRNKRQKSYNLSKQNCVHFVGETLRLLGLEINEDSKYFGKPKSFLFEVESLNPQLDLIGEREAD